MSTPLTAPMTRRQVLLRGLALGAALEAVTVLLRFGLRLESTRDTASTIGALTFGLRVHHGYIGLLMVIVALLLPARLAQWAQWLAVIGLALFLSDLVHHFLILWPLTGSPHFDLTYPR